MKDKGLAGGWSAGASRRCASRVSSACRPGPALALPPSRRSVNEPKFPSAQRPGTSRGVQGSGKFPGGRGAVWAEVRTGAGPEAVGSQSSVSTWGYHSAFPNSGGPGVASVTISACWGASRDTHFRIGRGSERDCALRGGRGGGLFRFSPGFGA